MIGISWSSGLRHQDLSKVILQVCGSIPSPAQYFFIKLIFHELLFSFLKFIKNIFMFLIAYFQFFWKISSFQTSANKFIYQWYFKSIKVGPSNFYSGKLWFYLPSTCKVSVDRNKVLVFPKSFTHGNQARLVSPSGNSFESGS